MDLLKTIKKGKNARKLFGKRELVIIEKQLLGVRLKASEKTRLSRDIRKKFDAIKEIADFSDEFGLKRGACIKSMIEEAKEVILEHKDSCRIKRILIFGSAAENQLTLSSDIDLAVEFDKIMNNEALLFRREILSKVNEKIDIQVFNVLPAKIKKEIQKKGKMIYERENK